MKNILQSTPITRLSKDEALKYILEVYGETVETNFDEACIGSVVMDCPSSQARIEYIFIRVLTKDGHKCYWPIRPYSEEIKFQAALEILQRKASEKV